MRRLLICAFKFLEKRALGEFSWGEAYWNPSRHSWFQSWDYTLWPVQRVKSHRFHQCTSKKYKICKRFWVRRGIIRWIHYLFLFINLSGRRLKPQLSHSHSRKENKFPSYSAGRILIIEVVYWEKRQGRVLVTNGTSSPLKEI